MYVLVSVLIIIASILLSLIVLVQNSKGGGLASNFSGSNQVMGVRKTTDFLEKATWTLAVSLVVLCLVAAMVVLSYQQQKYADAAALLSISIQLLIVACTVRSELVQLQRAVFFPTPSNAEATTMTIDMAQASAAVTLLLQTVVTAVTDAATATITVTTTMGAGADKSSSKTEKGI